MFMPEVSIGDEVQCKLTLITQAPGKNEKKKLRNRQICDVASHGYKGTEF